MASVEISIRSVHESCWNALRTKAIDFCSEDRRRVETIYEMCEGLGRESDRKMTLNQDDVTAITRYARLFP